jgi:hypothetical protein
MEPIGREAPQAGVTVARNDPELASHGLRTCLQEAFAARTVRLMGREQLKIDVHRLRLDVDGDERSVVVKWSDPVVARRCELVARRWLPAAGLEDQGPPLLAVAAERTGEGSWHVYDDLPGHQLSTKRLIEAEVEAAICAIARVHTAFAEHPLIPEFRLWGGDRGARFYSANISDAVVALRSLQLEHRDAIAARDELLRWMARLKQEEPERTKALDASGGPETLLHGDLWPTNVLIVPNGGPSRVRLIDWDEAAAGPIGFDLSTFLLRFDPSHRRWILETYGRTIDRLAGWKLPPEQDLTLIFETAAYARLASLLVWSIADFAESPALDERLVGIVDWLDAVSPVLPAR